MNNKMEVKTTWTDKDQREFDEWVNKRNKEYKDDYTEEEKAEIDREWAEVEHEKWIEEHIKQCPKCGAEICDQAPNGAGELVDCDWSCDICGWNKFKYKN